MASTDVIQLLAEKIKSFPVAMLTTQTDDGMLRSRPMIAPPFDDQGNLWFVTRHQTGKVEEASPSSPVNVSYASPEQSRFVSLSGTARVVRDPARMLELWNSEYAQWFPEGAQSPDLSLLKVAVESAEYWDQRMMEMVHIEGFAKTVRQVPTNEFEHKKVEIKRQETTAKQ